MTTPTAVVFDLDGPPDPDDECSYLAAGFRRLAARHGLRRVPADELAEGLLATGDRSADRVAPSSARRGRSRGRGARN